MYLSSDRLDHELIDIVQKLNSRSFISLSSFLYIFQCTNLNTQSFSNSMLLNSILQKRVHNALVNPVPALPNSMNSELLNSHIRSCPGKWMDTYLSTNDAKEALLPEGTLYDDFGVHSAYIRKDSKGELIIAPIWFITFYKVLSEAVGSLKATDFENSENYIYFS
jgi:hypothetical protein